MIKNLYYLYIIIAMNDLDDFIEKLKQVKLIIVEGKKDKAALEKFGIKNIFVLNGPLYKNIEDISYKYKEVVILTDLDKEGRKLFSRLNSRLQERGIKVDNSFREFLFKETKLRQIEGIDSYIENNL